MDADGGEGAVLSVIRTVAETGSTNADLLALAREGMIEEGVWLRAERQSAGRGRQGRAWLSPVGNLSASTAVRLRAGDPPASTLGFVAAVALEEAVRTGAPSGVMQLKWPNDVLIGGAKLSGILLERADDFIVVGVGVNLAHTPDLPDRRTTSLAEHGVLASPAVFVEALAACFSHWLDRWREQGFAAVRARWLERAHPPGTPLRAALPDGSVVAGAFEDIDAAGALILRLADGARRAIHAGDVFLV